MVERDIAAQQIKLEREVAIELTRLRAVVVADTTRLQVLEGRAAGLLPQYAQASPMPPSVPRTERLISVCLRWRARLLRWSWSQGFAPSIEPRIQSAPDSHRAALEPATRLQRPHQRPPTRCRQSDQLHRCGPAAQRRVLHKMHTRQAGADAGRRDAFGRDVVPVAAGQGGRRRELADARVEVRDWTSAFALVREDVGVALVPEPTMPEDRRGLRVLRLAEPLYRRFGLQAAARAWGSPAVQAVLDVAAAGRPHAEAAGTRVATTTAAA